jgi:dihydrolipoamide dehydrogenase
MAENYDVIIIGSGPGGYVAAVRASQLGLKTAIVEREHLGGICLNWGCIPTKALLRSAEILDHANHAKDYGLVLEGKMSGRREGRRRPLARRLARLNGGVGFLMKKNKVDVIWGEAKITKPGEIVVGKSSKPVVEPQNPVPKNVKGEGTYTAKHIIVATGARPRALPGIEPDGKLIWTYFEAMKPGSLPKSLIVMGSGAIGIEFASFYRSMGVDVTVVEVMPTVMPVEDAEVSRFAQAVRKAGMKIITSAKVTKVEKACHSVTAHVETAGRQGPADHRRPHDLGRRRAGQHRKPRPRGARREDRPRLRRHRRLRQDQCARHLRHRRRRRPADAGPQGRA